MTVLQGTTVAVRPLRVPVPPVNRNLMIEVRMVSMTIQITHYGSVSRSPAEMCALARTFVNECLGNNNGYCSTS